MPELEADVTERLAEAVPTTGLVLAAAHCLPLRLVGLLLKNRPTAARVPEPIERPTMLTCVLSSAGSGPALEPSFSGVQYCVAGYALPHRLLNAVAPIDGTATPW